MLLKTDTSKIGLLVGGGIACISVIVLFILFFRSLSLSTTDLPFPKVEAGNDLVALRKSANDGNDESQLSLAGMYYVGKNGVNRDSTSAIQWLSSSAGQSNVTAELILGLLYFRGEAVTKDLPTAKEWFAKAGYKGNAEAQYYLGIMFKNGMGVPVDRQKAYVWLNLAKAQGHEKATAEFQKLQPQMTTAEVADAQKITLQTQTAIQQTLGTPENSVSLLLKQAQQAQSDLTKKADAAQAELERIKAQDGDVATILNKALPSVATVIALSNGDALQGSAFFIDGTTFITNFHVVESIADADKMYPLGTGPVVLLVDNQKNTRLAQVIATGDHPNDLAALTLTNVIFSNGVFSAAVPDPYPALSLQLNVQQGQTVFAVGSPRSFAGSVMKGIVSAIRQESAMSYIQTDAQITHGNSGGPLLNTNSEVIGVNTLDVQGVKFAIAASNVQQFLDGIPQGNKWVAYYDPSVFNTTTSNTQTSQGTTSPDTAVPNYDCSKFGTHSYYSDAQSRCACYTGYYFDGSTCTIGKNCAPNSTFNSTNNQCECNLGYILQDSQCILPPICPTNSTLDPATNKCNCDYGYIAQNGICIVQPSCPPLSTYDVKTSKCYCYTGYIWKNNQCTDTAYICGFGGTYNSQTGGCSCLSGFYLKNGQCEMEPSCYGGKFDPVSGGCICDSSFYQKNGSCAYKPSCGEGGYFDTSSETCICNAGYKSYGNFCMKDY